MPAYNSYYPATYQNPYVYQPQNYTPQQSIIWIPGEREAMAYPVAPNNAVTLWSQSEPVVYLKQADASGKPSMKVYDLVERTVPVPAPANKTEYITKADFTGTVDALKEEIETIKKQIKKEEAE